MKNYSFSMILVGIEGVLRIAVMVLLSLLLRRWYSRWGATEGEAQSHLTGDKFVPHPRSELTCAITVHAPAKHVWPWFVQLGCQRAGWYSYDLLDNGGVPSANRILPEYQHLAVGDIVKAVPNGSFGFPVAEIEPGRAISLAGTINTLTGKPADPNDPALEAYFAGDQTFVIEPLDAQTSRLIFRMRVGWNPSRMNTLIYRGFLEPISFVMIRKMLLNVKHRAEMLALEEVRQLPLVTA